MLENYPDVMTVEQVANAIGFSKPIVYSLLHCGAIRHFVVNKSFRVPKKALVEFIDAGGCPFEAVSN